MTNEYETFYDEVKLSSGVLRLTIPHNVAEYAGYKEGDSVKVMIKKLTINKTTVEERLLKKNDKRFNKWKN